MLGRALTPGGLNCGRGSFLSALVVVGGSPGLVVALGLRSWWAEDLPAWPGGHRTAGREVKGVGNVWGGVKSQRLKLPE